jgi:hypothetical protein
MGGRLIYGRPVSPPASSTDEAPVSIGGLRVGDASRRPHHRPVAAAQCGAICSPSVDGNRAALAWNAFPRGRKECAHSGGRHRGTKEEAPSGPAGRRGSVGVSAGTKRLEEKKTDTGGAFVESLARAVLRTRRFRSARNRQPCPTFLGFRVHPPAGPGQHYPNPNQD